MRSFAVACALLSGACVFTDSDPLGDGDGDNGGDGDECTPVTCAELEATCGELDDGCGGTLACGSCNHPAVCGGRGAANLCAIPEADRECTGPWCFENPSPRPMEPLSMFARSPDDVWAVGANGAVSRFDGERWTAVDSGTEAHLSGVWAAAGDDAWAVGAAGAFLHWDGSSWSPVSAGQGAANLGGVSGSGPANVWVVGTNYARRFDGDAWRQAGLTVPALDDVYAAPGQTWAIGEQRVWSWNGLGWDAETSEPGSLSSRSLRSIGGRSTDDVWVIGSRRSLFTQYPLHLHNDGTGWTTLDIPDNSYYWEVSATSDRVVAAGSDGVIGLSGAPFPALDLRVRAGGAVGDTAFAMTEIGAPHRLAAGAWVADGTGSRASMVAMTTAGDRVWFGGVGVLLEWTGGGFLEHRPRPNAEPFVAVAGTSDGELWAVEGSTFSDWTEAVWRFDGLAWHEVDPPDRFAATLAIAAPGGSVLTAGAGSIERLEGEQWIPEHQSEATWRALSADATWAAGELPGAGAVVARRGDTGWVETPIPDTSVLCGLHVAGTGDVWAAGYQLLPDDDDIDDDPEVGSGTVSHFDGETWSTTALSGAAQLCSIAALGPADVYATGAGSALFHFDGDTWQATRVLSTGSLRALATAGDTLWATGDHGAILTRPLATP